MIKPIVKINNFIWIIMGLLFIGLTGCSKEPEISVTLSDHVEMQSLPIIHVVPRQEQLLQDYISSMTLEEKVGQLFYVTVGNLNQPEGEGSNVMTELTEAEIETLQEYRPGGIILMGDNIESDEQVSELTAALQSNSEVPLWIGVDEEGGTVSRLGNASGISMDNVGTMRTIGATGDSANAYAVGEELAIGLSALGFNMDFAPVADVLTNPLNTEIGSRSFGSDADLVSDMVSAEISGLQEHGVSAVAKHFPGHGGVIGNTHKNLQYIDTSLENLRQEEFLPFQAAIETDTDVILVSHLVLISVESERPSTLSESVVTGLLREDLGYEGVVITDSFQMGSITENYTQSEAAVWAIQSGCDMILMPTDYEACYRSVLEAVQDGRITEEQIDAACTRILQTKIKRGILTLE